MDNQQESPQKPAKKELVKAFFKKHFYDLVAVLSVLVVSGACLIYYAIPKGGNLIARVYRERETIATYNLNDYGTETKIEIQGTKTKLLLGLRKNAIAILESGCPNQYCVHQGYVSDPSHPIVCTYNGIFIAISRQEVVSTIGAVRIL
jgi:hypothetical protein